MRIIVHRKCRPSGERLRSALTSVNSDRVVNWGLSLPPDDPQFINQPSAVRIAVDKEAALRRMADEGVPVPTLYESRDAARGNYPVVGRSANHRHGGGLWIARSDAEFDRIPQRATHFMPWIDDVAYEYRVHVIGRRVVKTSQKTGGVGLIRSHRRGWTFKTPDVGADGRRPVTKAAIKAVRALGLDFGAVDILVDAAGSVYVIEVNTAPSVADETSTTFDQYVAGLTRLATQPRE